MVVAYSLGKKSLAAHETDLQAGSRALERARDIFVGPGEEDAPPSALVNELSRLPDTDPRRAAELPGAIEASIQVPRAAIATCTELLRLCGSLAPITNRHLHSDLAIAAVLAEAAARANLWNIRVNAALLPGIPRREALIAQALAAVEDTARRRATVEAACTH